MPGKSRHGKGKHAHHSKKSKAKQRYGTITPQQYAVADTTMPAATTGIPPSASAPTAPKTLKVAQYPYITTELRRIGILAGIILVILIVLTLILS